MERALLLIDDESSTLRQVLTNVCDTLKRDNIIVKHFDINPLDRKFYDLKSDPDIDLVVEAAFVAVKNYKVGLVIVDHYYSDASFNGLAIINKLRENKKFKSCPIFLTSGKRDRIVADIFDTSSKTREDKVQELSKLISNNITRFLDKNFKDEAIESLKRPTLEEILPIKLREFENVGSSSKKLQLFDPKRRSITYGELADKIESNDPESRRILDEIFDLTLSHYSTIDEKLQ